MDEARVEEALTRARTARSQADLTAATAALVHAVGLADPLGTDHPLMVKARWRLAKVHHDQGAPDAALTALGPLFEPDDADPFLGYPQGRDAVGPLATLAWHRLGYADPRIDRLWQRVQAAFDEAGDPVRATQARLQRLWSTACRGARGPLTSELDAFATLDVRRFAEGPSRHPRAPDAIGSVPWLQLDAARTALRAATWSRDPDLADRAEDLFEDAATDADLDRSVEIWFLEPIGLIRRRLDRPDPDDYALAWFDLADRIDYPRRAYHHRVALAEAARVGDPATLRHRYAEAADVARTEDYGPEWEADARFEAGDPEAGRALVERYGVEAFASTLSDTSAT